VDREKSDLVIDATVLGDALIDEVLVESGSEDKVGGAALNVALGLRALGVTSSLIAMVGDDLDGDRIRASLREGDVPFVSTPAPWGTARATSTRVNGEPSYSFNPAAINRRIGMTEDAAATVDSCRFVILDCLAFDNDAQVDDLVRAIRDPASRLVIDPNPREGMLNSQDRFRKNFLRIAASSLLVKVSDEDAEVLEFMSVSSLAKELLASGARFVLTTEGARGAALWSADGVVAVPVADAIGPIIDTMGAGDATLSTVISSLTQGIPETAAEWRTVLTRAMAVAAATCRSMGPLLRTPEDSAPLGSKTY
jgi:fructokinase